MNVDICPSRTLKESIREADVIFTGPVTDVKIFDPMPDRNGQQRIIVTFQNKMFWKSKGGVLPRTVKLYTRTNSLKSLEGFSPVVGQEYLIFSAFRQSYFWTTWKDIKQAKRLDLTIDKHMLSYDKCLPSGLISAKTAIQQGLYTELGAGKIPEP
jgi:hypothetical protein